MKTKYPRLYALLTKSHGDDAENEIKRMLDLFGPMGMALEEASCPKPKIKTTRSEKSVKKSILEWCKKNKDKVKCFNNAVGFFDGYSFGLGKKTSDLIGAVNKNGVAVFFTIEVKEECWTPPKPETKAYNHYKGQLAFINDTARFGGLSGFATSLQDFKRILGL